MKKGRIDAPIFHLRAHGVTDQGPTRRTNEDRFVIEHDLGLFVLADGMGGHHGGEIAARVAVEAIVECVRRPDGFGPGSEPPSPGRSSSSQPGQLLRSAVRLANERILERASGSVELTGMGTTVVAALIRVGILTVAHVGDSRAYLYKDERLRSLTRDDSWVAAILAENPDADPAAFRHHPMRNVLTSVVGSRAEAEVHVAEQSLFGGEWVVLTTDGVHSVVEDAQLERLLAEGHPPAEVASRIVQAALVHGSSDNCTAVVIQVVQ
jgi:protein phosphatase